MGGHRADQGGVQGAGAAWHHGERGLSRRPNTPLSIATWEERAREQGIIQAEINRRRLANIPSGHANEPRDIAEVVAFLAGPGGRNITGQAINVDGGIGMHRAGNY